MARPVQAQALRGVAIPGLSSYKWVYRHQIPGFCSLSRCRARCRKRQHSFTSIRGQKEKKFAVWSKNGPQRELTMATRVMVAVFGAPRSSGQHQIRAVLLTPA